jgi:hypothetical protein
MHVQCAAAHTVHARNTTRATRLAHNTKRATHGTRRVRHIAHSTRAQTHNAPAHSTHCTRPQHNTRHTPCAQHNTSKTRHSAYITVGREGDSPKYAKQRRRRPGPARTPPIPPIQSNNQFLSPCPCPCLCPGPTPRTWLPGSKRLDAHTNKRIPANSRPAESHGTLRKRVHWFAGMHAI